MCTWSLRHSHDRTIAHSQRHTSRVCGRSADCNCFTIKKGEANSEEQKPFFDFHNSLRSIFLANCVRKIMRQSRRPRIFREKNDMKTFLGFYFCRCAFFPSGSVCECLYTVQRTTGTAHDSHFLFSVCERFRTVHCTSVCLCIVYTVQCTLWYIRFSYFPLASVWECVCGCGALVCIQLPRQ